MTFTEALSKALLEQEWAISRKGWQQGIAVVISKSHLDLQHITTCSIKGPKPHEYLEDDWQVGVSKGF